MADEFLPPYSPRPHPPYFTAPSNPRQSSPHRRTIQIQPGDCLEIDEQVRAMGIGRSNERQAALLAESATVMSAGERIYLATSLISLAFSVVRHFAMSVMVDIWSPAHTRPVQASYGNANQDRESKRPTHLHGDQHLDDWAAPNHVRTATGDTGSRNHHRNAAHAGVLLFLIGLYDLWVSLRPIFAAFGRLALALISYTEREDPSIAPWLRKVLRLLRGFLEMIRWFARSWPGRVLLFIPVLMLDITMQATLSMLRVFLVWIARWALGIIYSTQRV